MNTTISQRPDNGTIANQLKAAAAAAETKAHDAIVKLEESPSSLPRLIVCLCACAELKSAREAMARNG